MPDSNTVQKLFGEHQQRLKRFARRFVDESDAEDILQEAFARLLDEGKRGRRPQLDAYAVPWLYRVVRNLCLDRLRLERRNAFQDPAELEAAGRPENTLRNLLNDDLQALLRRTASNLAENGQYLRLLELLLTDTATQAEIAMELDCSERTVRRMTAALFEQLAQALGKAGIDANFLAD